MATGGRVATERSSVTKELEEDKTGRWSPPVSVSSPWREKEKDLNFNGPAWVLSELDRRPGWLFFFLFSPETESCI